MHHAIDDPRVTPASRTTVATLIQTPRAVTIGWTDGSSSTFPALWLRDNCACSQCRDAGSGQRILETLTISDDIALDLTLLADADVLRLRFVPDEHLSTFPLAWLRAHTPGSQEHPAPERTMTLWDGSATPPVVPAYYHDVRRDEQALHDLLAAVDSFGFGLLRGVPTRPGELFRVVDLFGFVRETNYGPLFDVRSVSNPNNLAYTSRALGPHTDNPYRDPPPNLQLLHCLSSSVSGGENVLVDGFRVAEELSRMDAEGFELLCSEPITFHFEDAETSLTAEVPVIDRDARGAVKGLHFNNRSRGPFVMDEGIVERYYRGYRAFERLLNNPELQTRVRLEPGDVLILDNLRILHGRTAFSGTGNRHLQGCYSDRDGLRSRLAVLERTLRTGGVL